MPLSCFDAFSRLFYCTGATEERSVAGKAEDPGDYGVHQFGSSAVSATGGRCIEGAETRADGIGITRLRGANHTDCDAAVPGIHQGADNGRGGDFFQAI
jgi:hypothetical protein